MESLFQVRKSGLAKAGYGLFAARPYAAGEIIGLFCGEVTVKVTNDKDRPYAMAVEWPPWKIVQDSRKKAKAKGTKLSKVTSKKGNTTTYVVDPGAGPQVRVKDYRPCFFGLHMANDPDWGKRKEAQGDIGRRLPRNNPKTNFMIDGMLLGKTTAHIRYGEELFLSYKGDLLSSSSDESDE